MRLPRLSSLRGAVHLPPPEPLVRYSTQHPLRRVMAFTGRSIDDVVNDPIAKNQVYGYFKLLRQIGRRAENPRARKPVEPHGVNTTSPSLCTHPHTP